MAKPPQLMDLERRYREADWVSEFQRLWAIFNHWFVAHFGNTKDRFCIDHLKKEPNLNRWIKDIIQNSPYSKRPQSTTEGFGGSYPRYLADNEISSFFRAVEASSVVEPRINHPWRPGTLPSRVKPTSAITLNLDQFKKAYEEHAVLLGSFSGITFDLTLHQTLPILGVHATGCCFYRGAIGTSLSSGTGGFAKQMVNQFRAIPSLAELVNMIDSTLPTELHHDVIETLYNVRNVSIHGSLDFLDEKDNQAARAAYDLLDSLIRDIRDRW